MDTYSTVLVLPPSARSPNGVDVPPGQGFLAAEETQHVAAPSDQLGVAREQSFDKVVVIEPLHQLLPGQNKLHGDGK